MIPQLRRLKYLHLHCLRLCNSRYYASHQSIKPKAVAFDMGGVVIPTPLPIFDQFEDTHSLQRGSIVSAIKAGGDKGNDFICAEAAWLSAYRVFIGLAFQRPWHLKGKLNKISQIS